MFSSESELESEAEEQGRIGNTDWCQCGECKPMATYKESLCRQNTNEVPEKLFEGQECIKKSSGFRMVCLEKPVLHASLSALNHVRGDFMKIWTTVHIDLQDTSNILFGCIIIMGKVFAKSFHYAPYGKYEMSTKQIYGEYRK